MNIYLVSQNPDSNYNDSAGEHYDYPTSIPNGKQIKVGDLLLFALSSKAALKLKFGEGRITGIAKIDDITIYSQDGKQMALASYEWFKVFETPLSFEQIGGDPRTNIQHSMNKISKEKHSEILLQIIKNGLTVFWN
jgi:hypothetical protein